MNVVDIHMHAIPGIDDGSRSMEESIELIRRSVAQGVDTIIMTPHSWALDCVGTELALARFKELKEAVKAQNIPVELSLGCEILVYPSTVDSCIRKLKNGKYPTMADSGYALLEFEPSCSQQDMGVCVRKIAKAGFRPIIAHAERYHNTTVELVRKLKKSKALVQINAYSIVNEKNEHIRSVANQLLSEKLVDFIGSDAHRLDHRPPFVADGIATLSQMYSEEYAKELLSSNPYGCFFFYDKVYQTVSEVLGEAHVSLSVNEKPKIGGVGFFYDKACFNRASDLLYYFNQQYAGKEEFPYDGMLLPFYDSSIKNVKKDCYVKLVNLPYEVELSFCPVEGIRFHKTYGKQITASIYTSKYPVLRVWIDKEKVIWTNSKDGCNKIRFNWWTNKCLRENGTIRITVIALLRYVGQEMVVFRDVAKTIENDGFFLPPLDYDQIKQCRVPGDFIEQAGAEKLDINYNKLDINAGYYLSCLAGQFDEQEGIRLRDYPKDRVLSLIQLKDLYEGPNAERFLAMHYSQGTYEAETWEIRQEVTDYLQMCMDLEVKPQICASYDAFIRKHDELVESYRERQMEDEINKPLVPENSQFKELDELFKQEGMENYEWITTGRRLYEEGKKQHNCVFTYRDSIRKDLCAIFHLDRNNESYTIQINKDKRGKFYVEDMRGRFNHACKEGDFAYLNRFLQKANRTGTEEDDYLEDLLMDRYSEIGHPLDLEPDDEEDDQFLPEPYEPWSEEPEFEILPWSDE